MFTNVKAGNNLFMSEILLFKNCCFKITSSPVLRDSCNQSSLNFLQIFFLMRGIQLFCHFEVQNFSAVLKKKNQNKQTNNWARRKYKLKTKISGVQDIENWLLKALVSKEHHLPKDRNTISALNRTSLCLWIYWPNAYIFVRSFIFWKYYCTGIHLHGNVCGNNDTFHLILIYCQKYVKEGSTESFNVYFCCLKML